MAPKSFLAALLGVSVAQGLRIPASRRTTNTRRSSSFSVTRPGASSRVPTTVNAATTGNGTDDNDISSVRDIVYMASVTVAGKGTCKMRCVYGINCSNQKQRIFCANRYREQRYVD